MPLHFRISISTLFRGSIAGQALYCISGKRVLKPLYSRPSYEVPEKYTNGQKENATSVREGNAFSYKESISGSESCNDCPSITLVDWDGPGDPENPLNWPTLKKVIVAVIICAMTTSVYMSTAIFTPAEEKIQKHMHTSSTKVLLGLTLFIWGYGVGPLLVSAMSESPAFGGRNYIYFISQLLFVVLQIPTALSNHIGPFVVLRFLAGICAASPMTNGVATLGDMFEFPASVWSVIAWNIGAVAGPYLGPLIGSALVDKNTWRWSIWYLLVQAGAVLLFMLFLLPETSPQALLMNKARYLRKLTGNQNIKARGDILLQEQKWGQIIKEATLLPIEMVIKEPVLLLMNLHLSLVYSVFYLYFESYPIVFAGIFNFTLVEQGAGYLALLVGCFVSIGFYVPYITRYLIRPSQKGDIPEPEHVLVPAAIVGSVAIPIGILIFGWTSTPSAHWIAPLIGAGMFEFGTSLIFQTYVPYFGQLFPTRFASAMASNTLMRCLIGGTFPLFGAAMYKNTAIDNYPVGWGCSILAFIAIALIALPIYLRIKGADLRAYTLRKYGTKFRE